MIDSHTKAIKIIGGVKDQCWKNQNDLIAWVEKEIEAIKEEVQNDIVDEVTKIQDENPLNSDFESDARYTWPKRWDKLIKKIKKA